MKITITIFIALSVFGSGLTQIVNHIYIESSNWTDSEGTLGIISFIKNNLYKRYRWNTTTHQIQELESGEYYVLNDTIICRSANSVQKLSEFVSTKLEGKNVLLGNDKVYNQDGSLSTIRIKGPPREELGKELYKQWKQELNKN